MVMIEGEAHLTLGWRPKADRTSATLRCVLHVEREHVSVLSPAVQRLPLSMLTTLLMPASLVLPNVLNVFRAMLVLFRTSIPTGLAR